MTPPSRQTWQVQKGQSLLGEGRAKLVFLIIALGAFLGLVLLVLALI